MSKDTDSLRFDFESKRGYHDDSPAFAMFEGKVLPSEFVNENLIAVDYEIYDRSYIFRYKGNVAIRITMEDLSLKIREAKYLERENMKAEEVVSIIEAFCMVIFKLLDWAIENIWTLFIMGAVFTAMLKGCEIEVTTEGSTERAAIIQKQESKSNEYEQQKKHLNK